VVVNVAEEGGVGCRERDVLVRCDDGGRREGQSCRGGYDRRSELHSFFRAPPSVSQNRPVDNRLLEGKMRNQLRFCSYFEQPLLYSAITCASHRLLHFSLPTLTATSPLTKPSIWKVPQRRYISPYLPRQYRPGTCS